MSRPRTSLISQLERWTPSGSRLLVAVSGGIDSMVLLSSLIHIRRRKRLHIEVAHVDHAIRPDSAQDAELVRSFCASHELAFHMRRLDSQGRTENLEAWGRRERYRFFARLRRTHHLDFVLTAHHAHDAAETLLMRLVSGKEPRGIALRDPRRKLLRPLLHVERALIENFALRARVPYREDSTNQDERLLRNRIRHRLIPFLERNFHPRIVEVLSRQAQLLESDLATLSLIATPHELPQAWTRAWLKALTSTLLPLPESLRMRYVQAVFLPLLGFKLSIDHARRVVEFVIGTSLRLQLPGGVVLRRQNGGLVLQ